MRGNRERYLKRLYTRADASPERTLAFRGLLVLLLLAGMVAIMWFDRAGLKDNADGHMSFVDVMYFTMVTITTVGYGDIVPVSDRARLIDTFLLNPVRLIVWFIFIGTAYQFVVQRLWEDLRMNRLRARLRDHVIVCGYGHTGRSAAQELLAKGSAPESLVVIDNSPIVTEEAGAAGFIAMRGDATHEAVLRDAGIEQARALIVAVGRDDTAVLTVLTARQLNTQVRVLAVAKKEENGKLLRQSGADTIVSPPKVGGYLLAEAVERRLTVDYLYDLMTEAGDVKFVERPVAADEIGVKGRAVRDGLIMKIRRGAGEIGFWAVEETLRQGGDVLLVLAHGEPPKAARG